VTRNAWTGGGEQATVTSLLAGRLETDADGRYLDVCGTALSAGEVDTTAGRLAGALAALGVRPGDRVATLLENSPEAVLAWFGIVVGGGVAVPVNTAYKGAYLRHQLADSGSSVLVVHRDFADRAAEVVPDLPDLRHLVIVDAAPGEAAPGGTNVAGGADAVRVGGAALGAGAAGVSGAAGAAGASALEPGTQRFAHLAVHGWADLLGADLSRPPVEIDPSDLATFVYTGGTTGPSKGCMLSHGYHEALTRQIGICWQRTAEDVVWTPLPLFHFNALTTAVCGPLVWGGRAAIYRRFSVSNFWSEMNRTGATITSTLGTMAYLLAHDVDRPEMPRSGATGANGTLRLLGAAPMPVEVDTVIRKRFGVETFSGAYGVTEASLISWQPPGVRNRPNAAGVVNDEYFDVRIFDDADHEMPADGLGEIVVRPRRPHVMFEGYWGRPEATVEASRNWWYHTGDMGRVDADRYLYFIDRKADYLRRRGENISSFEVESVLMSHGELADVAVHAVPSKLTEDDLKVTATRKEGATVTEEELFRWCVDALPYFALPRYVEFRAELPRSPVGRVLKRELRAEGVTPATWDAEAAGVTYEKR
jgi:crotonobetaine/carnitine-CoA ligase